MPHVFDLTPHLSADGNELEIIFDLPPRWLGQFGYTSQMTEWKTRFNYTWDWSPRLVQIGHLGRDLAGGGDGQRDSRTLRCLTDADPAAGDGHAGARGRGHGGRRGDACA